MWARGPVGMWACGHVGMWTCGPVGPWAWGPWACGHVGMWACGREGMWARGHVDMWTCGRLCFSLVTGLCVPGPALWAGDILRVHPSASAWGLARELLAGGASELREGARGPEIPPWQAAPSPGMGPPGVMETPEAFLNFRPRDSVPSKPHTHSHQEGRDGRGPWKTPP